jgi:hypothetical protein
VTPNAASPLLAEVLEAHGGLKRWRGFEGLSSTVVTGGRLWGLKGINMGPAPRVATTEFRRQWTSIAPFGGPDRTMTWTPGRVVIANGAGEIVAERENPRDALAGRLADTPRDPLHLAYFNGYAMWTYHALPFVLAEPGYRIVEVAPAVQDGEALRGLGVRFPEGVHTHTREQRLYFGVDGLLRRHDYEVDVWAGTPAAHMLCDYVEVGGLRLPTGRRVHPRDPDGSLRYDFDPVTMEMSNYVPRP